MTMKPNPMVILTGPTAVGKTALSIALAKKINGAIISADSMQVYKYMDIGSAKIMPEEMDGVRHYLVNELDPADEFHVVRFVEMAKQALKEITANGQIPIVVGGTGFYIQALLYDIDFTEQECDSAYRRQLEELAENIRVILERRVSDRTAGKRKLAEKQQVFLKAREKYEAIREKRMEAERILENCRAGILAKDLEEGQKCPVCGSVHHPELASLPERFITEEELEKYESRESTLQEQKDQANTEAEKAKTALEVLEKQLQVDGMTCLRRAGTEHHPEIESLD